jgi:hypothetical protein
MLIQVKDHTKGNGELKSESITTESTRVVLGAGMLEGAASTEAGRFLLHILEFVHYAAKGSKPVMLLGRKTPGGGFDLHLTYPILRQKGIPPDMKTQGGIIRTA